VGTGVGDRRSRGDGQFPRNPAGGLGEPVGVYYNEILLVKLDGSVIKRVAHHRSRMMGSYWFTPRAAMSGDGAFAIFDSNFGLKSSS